jgi:hypothetical protein
VDGWLAGMMMVPLRTIRRGPRGVELVVRLLLGAAVFAAVLWLIYTFFLDLAAVRAQFR